MLVGVLGATYSTIFLKYDNRLVIKATTVASEYAFTEEEQIIKLHNYEAFVLNSDEPIFTSMGADDDILSVIGIPIQINQRLLGYILVEHSIREYFNKEHLTFISSLANHIAIALDNNNLYSAIKDNANKDPLTGLFNRRYFMNTVSELIKKQDNARYAIVMIDIDHFKKCNDTYGHQFGDEVLKATAHLLQDSVREKDIVARYGGEEIIIYLHQFNDKDVLFSRINDIRQRLSENGILYKDEPKYVTASFGIAICTDKEKNVEEIINVADMKLYEAKQTGRNKVVI